VFLAVLFVFRSEPLMLAPDLLELNQERVPFRLHFRVILREGFQAGAQAFAAFAERRKLAGGLSRPFVRQARRGVWRPRRFRFGIRPVKGMGFRVRVPELNGYFLDLLYEKLVVTLLAPDVLTGQLAAHTQSGRATGAADADPPGLGIGSVQRTGLIFVRAWCHDMVGPEGAKRVLAMLAAHVAAAVGEPDVQCNQTVGTNRHEVRVRLAHGHFPRADKSRVSKRSAITILEDDLCTRSFQESPRISTGIHSAGASTSAAALALSNQRTGDRAPESVDPGRGRVAA
jgi:hypothetical protein